MIVGHSPVSAMSEQKASVAEAEEQVQPPPAVFVAQTLSLTDRTQPPGSTGDMMVGSQQTDALPQSPKAASCMFQLHPELPHADQKASAAGLPVSDAGGASAVGTLEPPAQPPTLDHLQGLIHRLQMQQLQHQQRLQRAAASSPAPPQPASGPGGAPAAAQHEMQAFMQRQGKQPLPAQQAPSPAQPQGQNQQLSSLFFNAVSSEAQPDRACPPWMDALQQQQQPQPRAGAPQGSTSGAVTAATPAAVAAARMLAIPQTRHSTGMAEAAGPAATAATPAAQVAAPWLPLAVRLPVAGGLHGATDLSQVLEYHRRSLEELTGQVRHLATLVSQIIATMELPISFGSSLDLVLIRKQYNSEVLI